MKLFKKIMAAALAAVMVLAMLTACGGTDPEAHVLEVLNQLRTETYSQSALTRSSEADTNAQNAAAVLKNYYEGSATKDELWDSTMQMQQTLAEGCTYKGQMIFRDPNSVTKESFDNYKSTVSRSDSQYVGAATFSACGWTYTIVVVY
ncbi:hypothetical protein [Faecalibacterium wellingii]|uniref:SCP domain-containing protein n=1 Tax=Faecalibacterium wellingii TaxID=2929491 RepID=A0ABU3U201_9FIRM|nr:MULTISPECIES: hypothetical protein [Faecalibacterium]MDU8689562.1 hypothetical protein [Faecalibacterium prausnitzii]UQK56858.1 hypothetical protein MTP37_01725 [Faecalibacterium sp. HTF-F]